MLNVPENLSGAVNRQTVLTINTKKVMEPLSLRSIGSINNMSCRNSPHTRCRQNCPNLKKSCSKGTEGFSRNQCPDYRNPGIYGMGHH